MGGLVSINGHNRSDILGDSLNAFCPYRIEPKAEAGQNMIINSGKTHCGVGTGTHDMRL